MGRATWGRLTEAWPGEARDFTPELARHLDLLDADLKLGLSLAGIEVAATGGRRIDIVASDANGERYVVENQYGEADHDHLTRGLAYAVSAEAAGLIVVAERHRDEFKEVVHYLNKVAAHAGGGIKVWLVEARAVRVDDGPWAPVFAVVAEPSVFTQAVAASVATYERIVPLDDVLAAYESADLRRAVERLVDHWDRAGNKLQPYLRGGKYMLGFWAPGPAASRLRAVVTAYPDGRLSVPFSAYQGRNSGIAIESLSDEPFVDDVSAKFELRNGYTPVGWFTEDRVPAVIAFCDEVAGAYLAALRGSESDAAAESALDADLH